jgi:hypothetical protein
VHPSKRALAWIVLLGGGAVLASYAYVLSLDPATQAGLWGGVPPGVLPAYLVSMILAAGGYFAFTYYLYFRVDPQAVRIAHRFGFGLFPVLYLLILIPSALWLPLTAAMVQEPSGALRLAIRLVLALVGAASVCLLLALIGLRPRRPAVSYWLAVAGALAFSFQTAVLDLFVWTALFPA